VVAVALAVEVVLVALAAEVLVVVVQAAAGKSSNIIYFTKRTQIT
jgi:hypothetical protein